ncbi:hypothetical protein LUW77_17425 [Streptomyces radiopugnans]|nr:hypothetical protein LUW77_17425 [Streptomyces radiopugnans]
MATARLLNARPLYDALAAHPEADLAMLLSDDIFRSTVAGGHTVLTPDDFARVTVQAKEYEATAWLHVPGLGASAAVSPEPRAAEAAGPVDPARREPASVRPGPAAAGGADGTGIANEYRADKIAVTNVASSVDARGAVFGFGSAGG